MSLMVTFKNEVVRICPKNAKKLRLLRTMEFLGAVVTLAVISFKI